MQENQREPISLGRGALLRVKGGKGTLVYVWEGEVWITEDGERSDHVLGPGQWFRLGKDGAVCAQAFSPAVLSLTVAPKAKWGQSKFVALTQAAASYFGKFALTPFRRMG